MKTNPVLVDPYLQVEVLNQTPDPQTLTWWAMHQDYSERYVFHQNPPSEQEAGQLVVKHLLAGERGHYGPLEHPAITFATGFFPHCVMQQARTHRIGCSFDVQSGRYTGQRVLEVVKGLLDIEQVFWLRPVGDYADRKGKHYSYTQQARDQDLESCYSAAEVYADKIKSGWAEEHARSMLPFDFRQHFVVSFSLRALLHFIDLRAKRDAQDEIRALCDLMWPHLTTWAPEVAAWYETTRLHKARLAP